MNFEQEYKSMDKTKLDKPDYTLYWVATISIIFGFVGGVVAYLLTN